MRERGELVRDYRARHGLTGKQLADRLGVSPRTVRGWEGGGTAVPAIAIKLIEALDHIDAMTGGWQPIATGPVADCYPVELFMPGGRTVIAAWVGDACGLEVDAWCWPERPVSPFPPRGELERMVGRAETNEAPLEAFTHWRAAATTESGA